MIGRLAVGIFTVDAWVKPDDTSAGRPIVGQYDASTNGFIFELNGAPPGDYLYMYMKNGGANVGSYNSGAKHVPVGVWTHVAFVRSGSSSKLYINGIDSTVETIALGATALNNAALSLQIGRRGSEEIYFDGKIDEVRVIKGTALTADQIRQAYEYGLRASHHHRLRRHSSAVGLNLLTAPITDSASPPPLRVYRPPPPACIWAIK